MRSRGVLSWFSRSCPCLPPRPRGPPKADAPTVVLGLEALAGAPDNVALEITDALRQRVAAAKGFQLLQGKDLVEVKLVFACPDEAPACMSQAGKSMGASKLIFGNVKLRRRRGLPGHPQAARREPGRRRELHGRHRPQKARRPERAPLDGPGLAGQAHAARGAARSRCGRTSPTPR